MVGSLLSPPQREILIDAEILSFRLSIELKIREAEKYTLFTWVSLPENTSILCLENKILKANVLHTKLALQ